MTAIGTPENPLRVAVVGSGPAGFYTAEHLLKNADLKVTVDMFDRLPTPFGLVRFGVAPDHQKIKNVTRVFEKIASLDGFRFLGNVDVGSDITLQDLQNHYHQVCYATGAPSDRRMGIEGEDLQRSHPATDFVAWYNGHPDYRDYEFDLSVKSVAVVGVGNVAVDVARILCLTEEELKKTDIAEHALEQLIESNITDVYMLGRRGPAQAAFTNPEARELGELAGADIIVKPEEAALDPLSQELVEKEDDRKLRQKIEMIQAFSAKEPEGKSKRLTLRFLVSPVALLDDGNGGVGGMQIVKNELTRTDDGWIKPRATETTEDIPVDMVFRSVGYRGTPIADLPFDDKRATVPQTNGRVTDGGGGKQIPGLYVAGWIKRGPTGIIGTNKPDGYETAASMAEDAAMGIGFDPNNTSIDAVDSLAKAKGFRPVSFDEWKRIDELETERGLAKGKPRDKFTRVSEIIEALGK